MSPSFNAITAEAPRSIQKVHLRLGISAAFGVFAAVLFRGQAQQSWILVFAVATLAVFAGVTTLWSP